MSHVVAPEVAEDEFVRFCETMDLDVDVSRMDDEERDAFEDIKRLLVARICDGSLVITDSGEPEYKPRAGGDPIRFFEPTGEVIMAGDSKRANAGVARLNAMMAAMTKQTEKRFTSMKMRDYKVCAAVAKLFLA